MLLDDDGPGMCSDINLSCSAVGPGRRVRPTWYGIHHRCPNTSRIQSVPTPVQLCSGLCSTPAAVVVVVNLHPARHGLCYASSRVLVLTSCRIIVHRVLSRPLRSWAPHGFSKAPFPLVPLPFPTMKVLCPESCVLCPFVPPRLLLIR